MNSDLVQRFMINSKCGPTNSVKNKNLVPFDFSKNNNDSKYAQGIPKLWNFQPIYFGKEDAQKLFTDPKGNVSKSEGNKASEASEASEASTK